MIKCSHCRSDFDATVSVTVIVSTKDIVCDECADLIDLDLGPKRT